MGNLAKQERSIGYRGDLKEKIGRIESVPVRGARRSVEEEIRRMKTGGGSWTKIGFPSRSLGNRDGGDMGGTRPGTGMNILIWFG